MTSPAKLLGAVLLMPALACGPAVELADEGTTSGAESTSATASTSVVSDPSTTSGVESTSASTSTSSSRPAETSSSSSGSEVPDPTDDPCGCPFICEDFCPPKGCPGYDPACGPSNECDIWEQDCVQGEKCNPWARNDAPAWNATRCFPVDPQASHVGEACTVQGNMSGVDTCGVAELCFDVDEAGEGTCVSFCGGSEQDPSCADGLVCSITNGGVLALCLPECDPLQQACAEGAGCFPSGSSFVCLPAPSIVIVEPSTCYLTGGCEPGNVCLRSDLVPGCREETGCCSPWCDLTNPICPPSTECIMWFEEGKVPPESEDVGICASPR